MLGTHTFNAVFGLSYLSLNLFTEYQFTKTLSQLLEPLQGNYLKQIRGRSLGIGSHISLAAICLDQSL